MSKFGFQKHREEIKRSLSLILQFDTSDPRLEFVTVMDVRLSKDIRYATVYISTVGSSHPQDEILEVLKDHKGFFRTELAHRLQIRHTPELRFEIDDLADRAQRIENILREDAETT
jgi:ribosome-binding factor A